MGFLYLKSNYLSKGDNWMMCRVYFSTMVQTLVEV
jgi:hypothetical protein